MLGGQRHRHFVTVPGKQEAVRRWRYSQNCARQGIKIGAHSVLRGGRCSAENIDKAVLEIPRVLAEGQ